MNKNVAALLSIDDAQLTNFGPIMAWDVHQSPVADLPAHLCVKGRSIENDINLILFFTWQNGLNDCLRLEKIISKKFSGLSFQLSFNADFFLLLRRTPALTLFVHQFFELGNIDNKSSFPSHELREIERKSVRVV